MKIKMKRLVATVLGILMTLTIIGCGKVSLEGTPKEILTKVYDATDFDDDQKEAMKYYQTTELTSQNIEAMAPELKGLKVKEAVLSAPLMSSVAYQVVVLRLEDGADVEEAKKTIKENANPKKWLCVEAEDVVVENIGDVIFYSMTSKSVGEKLKASFLALEK